MLGTITILCFLAAGAHCLPASEIVNAESQLKEKLPVVQQDDRLRGIHSTFFPDLDGVNRGVVGKLRGKRGVQDSDSCGCNSTSYKRFQSILDELNRLWKCVCPSNEAEQSNGDDDSSDAGSSSTDDSLDPGTEGESAGTEAGPEEGYETPEGQKDTPKPGEDSKEGSGDEDHPSNGDEDSDPGTGEESEGTEPGLEEGGETPEGHEDTPKPGEDSNEGLGDEDDSSNGDEDSDPGTGEESEGTEPGLEEGGETTDGQKDTPKPGEDSDEESSTDCANDDTMSKLVKAVQDLTRLIKSQGNARCAGRSRIKVNLNK